MTTNPNEIEFTQQDIVYDEDCAEECGKDEPLAFVNRDNPEDVIHESCLFALKPRARSEYIRIDKVPSGKPTAAEKVDAMIGDSLDEDEEIEAAKADQEYQLAEPVEVELSRDSRP